MAALFQILGTGLVQALQELKANKLRSFLSLTGITIGIFCIIAVFTVLDSMKMGIQKNMASLGSDIIYVGRWPWTAEEGTEYKWWEYWYRPSMTLDELRAVNERVPGVQYATLYIQKSVTVKYDDIDAGNVSAYGVTNYFDKMQNFEVEQGRYLSQPEIEGAANVVVIGRELYENLFPAQTNPIGKSIQFLGKSYKIIGVLKKAGDNMTGFDFDEGLLYSYYNAASVIDVRSLNYDPNLMVKAKPGYNADELQYEVEGALRSQRRVAPGMLNNFSINKLSQINKQIDAIFGMIDIVGLFIGGLSLLVGAFGIANIMFVTVKERTRIIGLKKAIGAQPVIILIEFLIESVTLCLIGGLIGIAIVLVLSVLVSSFTEFEIFLSIKNFAIGAGVSTVVGILAGFLPARSASRLDPVVAIRTV